MGKDLQLHPELGINARMTFCIRCGGPAEDLILLGKHNTVWKCESCDQRHIGRPSRGKCSACSAGNVKKERELGDMERIPGGPCAGCTKEQEEHAKLVTEGGVYWRCQDCTRSGVVKHTSELAQEARKSLGIKAPEPCGVEFDKESCPACRPGGENSKEDTHG